MNELFVRMAVVVYTSLAIVGLIFYLLLMYCIEKIEDYPAI